MQAQVRLLTPNSQQPQVSIIPRSREFAKLFASSQAMRQQAGWVGVQAGFLIWRLVNMKQGVSGYVVIICGSVNNQGAPEV